MKNWSNHDAHINTIHELHHRLGLAAPEHATISVFSLAEMRPLFASGEGQLTTELYTIVLEKNPLALRRYGRRTGDGTSSVVTASGPGPLDLLVRAAAPEDRVGWVIAVHPDALGDTETAERFEDFGFFDYATHEALHTRGNETAALSKIAQRLLKESRLQEDQFTTRSIAESVDILLDTLRDVLIRQAQSRREAAYSTELRVLRALDQRLARPWFTEPPNEEALAERLNLSVARLNDALLRETGKETAAYIQEFIVSRAKRMMRESEHSLDEIARRLGYPSLDLFARAFRRETGVDPEHYLMSH